MHNRQERPAGAAGPRKEMLFRVHSRLEVERLFPVPLISPGISSQRAAMPAHGWRDIQDEQRSLAAPRNESVLFEFETRSARTHGGHPWSCSAVMDTRDGTHGSQALPPRRA